ncbi:MAG: tripartite tricarboxylate transporter substrate binding protein [Alphaproteobacteria bacterium]|nr:tripartite tricarboxylate transporter substrate binding protein [Alphaproteobacteria bacterium]
MDRSRRRFVGTALAGGALLALPRSSLGADPIATLKVFVPANPGGGWDQTARSMEHALKAAGIVRAVQFSHVGGAGGTVGLPQFINQWKGQDNALMVSGMVMVGAIIANKSPVNLSQVVPIARLTGEYQVVVVPANSPHKSLTDLVAAFKANPGAVSWAGGSAASVDHIVAGMIARTVGVDPRRVAYVGYAGGGPAVAAIIGGQVTCGISGWAEFAEHIKAGKMRALGLSSEKRLAGIDVPTLKEQGIDVELANWRGVFAPHGISAAQQASLTDLITRMARSPGWAEVVKQRDWIDIFLAGAPFAGFVETEMQRVTAILKDLGLAS